MAIEDAARHVHALFVQSRWTGADLHRSITPKFSPCCDGEEPRTRIKVLEKTIAVTLHELAANAACMAPCRRPTVRSKWCAAT
jgi:hypothetical protein